MSPRALVQRFYFEVWNTGDEGAAHAILAPDLRFRGSLGLERRGPDGFVDYMRGVRAALGGYRCIIDQLVADAESAAARTRFRGRHRGPFLGFEPTGREVEWSGAAFFTMSGSRIETIWVLGDLEGLRAQLDDRKAG